VLALVAVIVGKQSLIRKGVRPLNRPFVSLWRRLPAQLPTWWRVSGLTTDTLGQVAFVASNIAYATSAAWLVARRMPVLGGLMGVVCTASCAYHIAQCVHGCDSEQAARACTVDSVLAVATGCVFASQVHIEAANVALVALSFAFFKDTFRLGYTHSHAMWHWTTAAAAAVSRPRMAGARAAAAVGPRGSRRASLLLR
jgi:hypothetical protein